MSRIPVIVTVALLALLTLFASCAPFADPPTPTSLPTATATHNESPTSMVTAAADRAAHGLRTAVEDTGIDHGGFDVSVAEAFLDSADVVAVFEQVGGEAVAEGVGVAEWLSGIVRKVSKELDSAGCVHMCTR